MRGSTSSRYSPALSAGAGAPPPFPPPLAFFLPIWGCQVARAPRACPRARARARAAPREGRCGRRASAVAGGGHTAIDARTKQRPPPAPTVAATPLGAACGRPAGRHGRAPPGHREPEGRAGDARPPIIASRLPLGRAALDAAMSTPAALGAAVLVRPAHRGSRPGSASEVERCGAGAGAECLRPRPQAPSPRETTRPPSNAPRPAMPSPLLLPMEGACLLSAALPRH